MPEKMKSEADGKHPKSHFLYTPSDEPSTWKIRYKDADGKISPRLLGACHAALTVGYRGQKADIPESAKKECLAQLKRLYAEEKMAWPEDKETTASADDVVYRSGLIFRAGTYEDKNLVVTEDDLQAAVDAFTAPVPAELEHLSTHGIKTFLDGKLGSLVSIWRDGASLYGQMAVPAWLDPLWAEAGRKVSIVWKDAAKSIARIGMVLSPRVEDAAVMSAYTAFAASRHDTPHGQSILQSIHDMAARSGAICTPRDGTGFVSKHESGGLQAMHDLATEHGADCPGSGLSYYSVGVSWDTPARATPLADLRTGTPQVHGRSVPFAGSRHSRADAADIQQIHDLSRGQGADCASGETGMNRRRNGMRLDSLAFWRAGGRRFREEARDQGITTVPDEETFSILDTEAEAERERVRRETEALFAERIAAAEAREKAAQAELFRATAQRLQGEAAAFADGLISGNKLLPAEREGVIGALTQAGMDDAAHGVVTFAHGGQSSRVDQLKRLYDARPVHGLTREQLAAGPGLVLMSGQTTPAGPDAVSDEKLLSMTAAGREALKRKKQA